MKISDTRVAGPIREESSNKDSIWDREIEIFGKGLRDKEKSSLYQQLHTLIDSGLDVSTSLSHIQRQASRKMGKVVDDITRKLISGLSLSQAFKETGKFSDYEIISLRIGEESGNLKEILSDLVQYYDEKIRQRKDLISALSYPVLIICAAIGAVFFMIFFIIPVFEDVFSRFGGELPLLTQQVIALSVLLRSYSWVFLVVPLFIAAAFQIGRRYPVLHFGFEKVMLSVPLINQLYRQNLMTKFTNSMGLLLNANVSLIRALELNEQMFDNQHLKRTLNRIKESLLKGATFSDSLEHESLFDENFKILIGVGEESGRLGFFFKKLSHDYRENLKLQTSLLNTTLEPALIIILGILVGTILISMYLPMFELSTQMSVPG